EPAALVEVCGCIRRIERIQIKEIKLLGKDRETGGQPVVSIYDVVEAGEGVEAFALNVSLPLVQVFQTRHISAHETIFETLKEEELVLYDRSANSDARRHR